jgi:hypothetical protein
MEAVEYCERRFLDACDMGRGIVVLRPGGDVMSGGSGGCVVFIAGGEMAGGDVAGEDPGDMTAVMAVVGWGEERGVGMRVLMVRGTA